MRTISVLRWLDTLGVKGVGLFGAATMVGLKGHEADAVTEAGVAR